MRYHGYHQRRGERMQMSRRDSMKWTCPVPGSMADSKKTGVNRFDRWYRLPRSAHMLYWRVRKSSELRRWRDYLSRG